MTLDMSELFNNSPSYKVGLEQATPDWESLSETKKLHVDTTAAIGLPKELFQLKQLVRLSIRCYPYGLPAETPEQLAGMPNLESLEIYDEMPPGIPEALWQMKQLTGLRLINALRDDDSATSVRVFDIPSGAELPNLYTLRLEGHKGQNLPDGIHESMPKLRNLDLSYNLLEDLPADIYHLRRLYTLKLNNNRLATVPHGIAGLRLRHLNLANNKIHALPLFMSEMVEMYHLDLSGNRLRVVPFEIWSMHPHKLYMARNHLTSIPKWMGGLSRLEILDLNHNELMDIPKSVYDLPMLRVLETAANPLRKNRPLRTKRNERVRKSVRAFSKPWRKMAKRL